MQINQPASLSVPRTVHLLVPGPGSQNLLVKGFRFGHLQEGTSLMLLKSCFRNSQGDAALLEGLLNPGLPVPPAPPYFPRCLFGEGDVVGPHPLTGRSF